MKPICLVGFMGSGKTSVGQELAHLLDVELVDLDAEIEKEEQRSIAEIFSLDGEEYFRVVESRVLRRSLSSSQVISLGGGAFARQTNIDAVNAKAISVWLDCTLEICIERCEPELHKRPLLKEREHLADLYYSRLPLYEQAHHRLDSNHSTVQQLANHIVEIIGN